MSLYYLQIIFPDQLTNLVLYVFDIYDMTHTHGPTIKYLLSTTIYVHAIISYWIIVKRRKSPYQL